METVKVTIHKGTVKVETFGFIGTACKDATAPLELALGKVTKDTPTSEMFQQAQSTELKQS